MSLTLFSQPWIEAWCRSIKQDEAYQEAAKNWKGAIVFTMTADPEAGVPDDRSVYLDLSGGTCHGGRIATEEDLESAPYIVGGPASSWQELLDGKIDPMMSLMGGKLRLMKGNMMSLIPHAGAAKALLASALNIDNAA